MSVHPLYVQFCYQCGHWWEILPTQEVHDQIFTSEPVHSIFCLLFSSVISQQRVAGLIPLEAITPICALFKPIRLLKQSFYIIEHGSVPLVRLFVTLFLFFTFKHITFLFFLTAAFYCLPIVLHTGPEKCNFAPLSVQFTVYRYGWNDK